MTFGAFQGQIRPLVEAAWRNHAGLYGVETSDRAERDEFYRAHLWAAVRIRTSKDASERQRVALVAHFKELVGGKESEAAPSNVEAFPGIRVLDWSPAQHRVFLRLAKTAHAAAKARENPGADAPFEAWLAGRMQDVCKPHSIHSTILDGYWHLGGCRDGFDKAMGALAVIAMDRYWILRTAEGTERRLRWQLDRYLIDLSWLEGTQVGWSYVIGIHKQAHHGLPALMEDATSIQLFDVLQMLDTQVRRLCRQWDIRPCYCPTREPSSPDLWIKWSFYHQPTPGHTRGPDGKLYEQQKGVA